MTVEIYFWSPTVGIVGPSKLPAIGHAALMVDGGSPAGKLYVSAWPEYPWSIVLGTAEYQDHMADLIAEDREPQVVRLRRLNETGIKKAIKQIKWVGLYSFPSHNCAQQAYACLRAGVPLTVGGFLSNTAKAAGSALLGPAAAGLVSTGAHTPWSLFIYAKSLVADFG